MITESQENVFQNSSSTRKRKDQIITNAVRLATYLILIVGLAIFGSIIVKGLPVIFGGDNGFINTEFLTQSPETLVVYENEAGEKVSINNTEYREVLKENPEAVFKDLHTHSYSGGGILGPLVGTALLVIVCITLALFIGICSAIYLNEYANAGKFIDSVRLAIINLAGVPSIVFGLFGWGVFCLCPWFPVMTTDPNYENIATLFGKEMVFPMFGGYLSFEGWGSSILAGGCTLAIMVLPVIITACEESLKAVPHGFREASFALGATRWQMIRTAVLPYAMPGILTASVLGVTRVAGETAPIMFTAAVADKSSLPWQDSDSKGIFWLFDFLTQSVQALPYHIYTVVAKIPQADVVKPMQNGSVFIFLAVVMLFSIASVIIRIQFRKKLKW